MAYYGGEEQRKKDDKKRKIDSFMNKAMPKRTFDQMGRETDRRTGKLLEDSPPKDLDDLVAHVQGKDPQKKKREEYKERKRKHRKDNPGPFTKAMKGVGLTQRREVFGTEMEKDLRGDFNQNNKKESYEIQLESLLTDPLGDLWNLHEAEMGVMQKPQIETDQPSAYGGPNDGNYEHPVAMKRAALDAEMHQGHNPVEAHQSVHGDVDLGDTTSKKMLAGTLGRVQDESSKNGVRMEPDKGSLLYKDHELEKQLSQVSHDDMRTPMRGQVPDRLQTPADEVAEETEVCYNYMDDVQFLQKYGRA